MQNRFDPFRDFDRFFERSIGSARAGTIPMDAYRHGDNIVIHLDLPGVDSSAVDIALDRNTLTVNAERHWEPVEGDRLIANERRQGRFVRQLFLGDGLDGERIHASYDNGVLTLTIPVAEKAKPKKIEIAGAEKPALVG